MAEWSKAHDWKSCVRHKRTMGSNPIFSAKKYCRKGYFFCSIFLSKSQTWYIITARSVVDIISPLGCISSTAGCILSQWWYTKRCFDEIQCKHWWNTRLLPWCADFVSVFLLVRQVSMGFERVGSRNLQDIWNTPSNFN